MQNNHDLFCNEFLYLYLANIENSPDKDSVHLRKGTNSENSTIISPWLLASQFDTK